ncbi:MAG: MBL fold metallo-hydrolase [Latescibacteria bacterium DG_63]|nr:MAG: MBL fold metallo-hydrolase [Latescibacteria bacterium DG_63]
MKLTVLVDNNTLTDRYLLAEPGASYFIEDEGKKILFDVGYSDVLLANAQRLSIDLLDVDFVVLSHGHLDHTWGLDPLARLYSEAKMRGRKVRKPMLVTHPLTFSAKRNRGLSIGSLLQEERLSDFFSFKFSREPVRLTERTVFLGEIERVNDFEAKRPLGKILEDGVEKDDFLLDDSALAYESPDGLVIITGCSHSGICNIVEHAKKICGDDRVLDIIGGLHLLNPPPQQLRGTIAYMKSLRPGSVHACHCTDLGSKTALSSVVDVKEVGVGLRVEH